MKINLKDSSIFGGQTDRFDDMEIDFSKPINFIFGRNGTGKSSICGLIRKQYETSDYDTYIFQGFESVIDEDKKLNAIVLGEENTVVNRLIKDHQLKIEDIQIKIDAENAKIKKLEDNKTKNLYTEKQKLETEMDKKIKEEQKNYTDGARTIANEKNPSLAENARQYDKNSFQTEISLALKQPKLSAPEKESLKKTIQATKKEDVNSISLVELNFEALQNEIKILLKKTVQPSVTIPEIGEDSNKQHFADSGRSCHVDGDKCAFCGGVVTSSRLKKLERYFSGSEIDALKNEINNKIKDIKEYKNCLEKINIDKSKFYPAFEDSVNNYLKNINDAVQDQKDFLKHCIDSLEGKQKDLFIAVEYESKDLPLELTDHIKDYNDIVDKNNKYTISLDGEKKEAQKKLRYDKIEEIVRNSDLEKIKSDIRTLSDSLGKKIVEIETVEGTIEGLIDTKEEEQGKINDLLAQTKNTEKLAKNINKKIKTYANFQLERREEDGREFYEIKEILEGVESFRPIEALSTGEKNIIAFLYFIESLSDAEKDHTNPKIVVFDDPMNSNDDTMQYLLVDELQKIIKSIATSKNKLIMFTHNVLFYLNVARSIKNEYGRKHHKDGSSVNPYEECNFYRLMACDGKTKIYKIQEEKDDFKSQYESLWYELGFLYSMKKPELMCNPIRRIIESYISFTQKTDFYKNNKDAKNLFNANSHDTMLDPTTDPLGKTHDEIKDILRKCFEDNNAKEHFAKYWKMATKNSN